MPTLGLYFSSVITVFQLDFWALTSGSSCSSRRSSRFISHCIMKSGYTTKFSSHCWYFMALIFCFLGSLFAPFGHRITATTFTPPGSFAHAPGILHSGLDYKDPFWRCLLLGSPFFGDLTQPVFCSVAGYPRRLCLLNNVQLHDQYLCAPHYHVTMAIPNFPISDLIFTGLYSLVGTLTSTRPPRTPPYLPSMSHGWCSSNIHTVLGKCCYLSAYVSGPSCARPIPFSPTATPICIDSGASLSMSNSREDFVNIQPVADKSLSGISTGLPIAGIGTIKWALMTDSGVKVDLYTHHSLYVPQYPMSLLSPQHLAQQTKRANDGFSVFTNVGILKFCGHTRTVLLDRASNLPTLHTLGHQSALPTTSSALAHPLTSLQVYTSKLDNLSQVQQQLLWVHYHLGHLGMERIQALARAGIFQNTSRPVPSHYVLPAN
jgi:hypothetical protein